MLRLFRRKPALIALTKSLARRPSEERHHRQLRDAGSGQDPDLRTGPAATHRLHASPRFHMGRFGNRRGNRRDGDIKGLHRGMLFYPPGRCTIFPAAGRPIEDALTRAVKAHCAKTAFVP